MPRLFAEYRKWENMKKYLVFDEDLLYEGKTKVFWVINDVTDEELGQIRWHSGWRQYCFYPDYITHWSRGCLKEVQNFIGKLMEARK